MPSMAAMSPARRSAMRCRPGPGVPVGLGLGVAVGRGVGGAVGPGVGVGRGGSPSTRSSARRGHRRYPSPAPLADSRWPIDAGGGQSQSGLEALAGDARAGMEEHPDLAALVLEDDRDRARAAGVDALDGADHAGQGALDALAQRAAQAVDGSGQAALTLDLDIRRPGGPELLVGVWGGEHARDPHDPAEREAVPLDAVREADGDTAAAVLDDDDARIEQPSMLGGDRAHDHPMGADGRLAHDEDGLLGGWAGGRRRRRRRCGRRRRCRRGRRPWGRRWRGGWRGRRCRGGTGGRCRSARGRRRGIGRQGGLRCRVRHQRDIRDIAQMQSVAARACARGIALPDDPHQAEVPARCERRRVDGRHARDHHAKGRAAGSGEVDGVPVAERVRAATDGALHEDQLRLPRFQAIGAREDPPAPAPAPDRGRSGRTPCRDAGSAARSVPGWRPGRGHASPSAGASNRHWTGRARCHRWCPGGTHPCRPRAGPRAWSGCLRR